jgi:hypothetical protein
MEEADFFPSSLGEENSEEKFLGFIILFFVMN